MSAPKENKILCLDDVFFFSSVSEMKSLEVPYTLLPGQLVYVRDLTEIWLEGQLSCVNNDSYSVFVTCRQVKIFNVYNKIYNILILFITLLYKIKHHSENVYWLIVEI